MLEMILNHSCLILMLILTNMVSHRTLQEHSNMGAMYSSCENCFGDKPEVKESQKIQKTHTVKRYNYNELKTENQTESQDYKTDANRFSTLRTMNTSSKIKHGRQRSGKTFVKEDIDPNKKLTIKDFDFVKVIGRGAYGKVFLVQKKSTRQLYALKTLKKSNLVKGGYAEQAMIERNVMQNASHPFVMKLHYSFQNENSLYYIMDFCPGGELYTQLHEKGNFDEETTRFYTAELILGLQYLHEEMNVIYRDLKPKNILLDGSGHIKITDFGLSKVAKKAHTICGTAEYVAPEVLENKGYDKTVDWWSLGCFVYEMLFGNPPFLSNDRDKLEQEILHDEPLMPYTFSETAKDFVSKLLIKDPTQRLGYNGAEEIMRHPFFNSIKWDEIISLKKQPPIIPLLTRSTDLRHFPKGIVDEPAVETPTASKVQVGSVNPFTNFTYVQRDLTDKNVHKPKMLAFDH